MAFLMTDPDTLFRDWYRPPSRFGCSLLVRAIDGLTVGIYVQLVTGGGAVLHSSKVSLCDALLLGAARALDRTVAPLIDMLDEAGERPPDARCSFTGAWVGF